jgi:hypothetical protein
MFFNGKCTMKNKVIIKKSLQVILVVSFIALTLSPAICSAETLERIVAIVDGDVVLMSEFEESFRSAEAAGKQLSQEAVINQMINRIILLREARRYGLAGKSGGGRDDDVVIEKFIDRRIKAFIHIPYAEIESYYNEHDDFKGKEIYDVKDEIEELLISLELVKRLRKYVEESRRTAYIRIQLKE